MNPRILLTCVATALALAVSSSAQVGWVATAALPTLMHEVNLPSAAYPLGGPSTLGPMPIPMSGAMPPPMFPAGGLAIDEVTSAVYYTNGLLITIDAHPKYLPFTPPIPPTPPIPAPGLLTGGPITGMAIDSAAGILWLCDPGSVGGFTLAPPYLPVTAPFFVPVAAAAGPLTGVAWDASTGTLWLTDAAGLIFHFTPAGLPIGPQPVAAAFVPGLLPVIGIDVNNSNHPGSFPPPGCSTQALGFQVMVTDGIAVYDAIPGALPPIPMPAPAFPGMGGGMAYANDFQITPGGVGCLSSGSFLLNGTAKSNHNGPAGFNALRMTGGTPGSVAYLLADLCPLPGGAALISGETLWINPFSPTFALIPTVVDAVGNATIPVSWVPVPAGIQFSTQWGQIDALHPLGICLSDMATITVGLP